MVWNTKIVAQTTQGKEISPAIRSKKGLPHGDAICPMLFILCLNPITRKVRATVAGIQVIRLSAGAEPGFFQRRGCKYESSRQISQGQRKGGVGG